MLGKKNGNVCFDFKSFTPLQEDSKGGDDSSGDSMAINNEHVVAHSSVERNLGDNVHASISKLQGYHREIGFTVVQEGVAAPLLLHFLRENHGEKVQWKGLEDCWGGLERKQIKL